MGKKIDIMCVQILEWRIFICWTRINQFECERVHDSNNLDQSVLVIIMQFQLLIFK
jgi:hypothetical protein